MKAKQVKTMMIAMITAIFFTGTITANAQNGQGCRGAKHAKMGQCELGFIPDLSDDQTTKIQESKTKHLKEVKPLKNKLDIKEAELKALATADKADMNAINKKIDEISVVKADLQKKRMAHIQEIRNLLTEDQRVIFDNHFPHKGHMNGHRYHGQHMQHGNHPNCPHNK